MGYFPIFAVFPVLSEELEDLIGFNIENGMMIVKVK
jgi:hypothetical protein